MNCVNVPHAVVQDGPIAVFEYLQEKIPKGTFNKKGAKGMKWTADFRHCALSSIDIERLTNVFNKKPWLTLLFPIPACANSNDIFDLTVSVEDGGIKNKGIEVIDLLTPVKEESNKDVLKESKTEAAKDGITKVLHMTPIDFYPAIKESFERIQSEMKKIEKVFAIAVAGGGESQVVTNAKDLLLALEKESYGQVLAEIAFAMDKLRISLADEKIAKVEWNDGPGNDVVLVHSDKSSASYKSAASESLLSDDGSVIYDSQVKDDFVETQPWDI